MKARETSGRRWDWFEDDEEIRLLQNGKRGILAVVFGRFTIIALLVLLEFAIIILAAHRLGEYSSAFYLLSRLLSVGVIIYLINTSGNPTQKITWIVLIFAVPALGLTLYLMVRLDFGHRAIKSRLQAVIAETAPLCPQNTALMEKLRTDAPGLRGLAGYAFRTASGNVYENNAVRYLPSGEAKFEALLHALEKAERFIFLEYFIIEPGVMWDSIHEILKQKASEGVTVRVMYDDMGSLNTLPGNYWKKLRQEGIEAVAFNRVHPLLNGIMNHRDHRKIMVIDGVTAYSGGINLADEYINVKHIHGHWKDNVIRITGEAVWSYTVLFLTNWNAYTHEDSDYTLWKREAVKGEPDGFIAPYGDTPLDFQLTGQDVYLNILNHARHYCYIFTPYLIIDTDMMNSLILAAKRGVDVRIITPGVPDKKIIWRITRSYYPNLIQEGVKIYEYTPGFDHAKVFVSDDEVATVGTINLDYRSLYLHFENGTALFHSAEINAIKADFLEAQKASHLVTMEEGRMGIFRTFFYLVLRIFAPMM